jgi:hypothetical protein
VIPAGTVRIDKGVVFTPGIDEGVPIEIPVPVYLIRTDNDENVLVDTGMHPAHIDDPSYSFGLENRAVVGLVNRARTQDGHIRNDTRVVSRHISIVQISPNCRRNCVENDRACTRVTPRSMVRRGPTVRVRQRASAKRLHSGRFR